MRNFLDHKIALQFKSDCNTQKHNANDNTHMACARHYGGKRALATQILIELPQS